MKKIVILFLFSSIVCFGQVKLKTYYEKVKGGYVFLADNDEYCYVFVRLNFSLSNLKSSNGNNKIFVIPERSKRVLITELKAIKNGKYGFKYKTKFNFGNPASKMDTSYVYDLPFKPQKSIYISQGYFGKRTHQGQRALDFKLPIGTDIHAAREGVVIKVVDTNTRTCYKKGCEKYNNEIIIYHNDGSFSAYAHLDTNTAKVKVGQKVLKGQLIAKSGNIGYSSGPHLHFCVYTPQLNKRRFYETKFKIYEDGVPVILRREGVYYLD